MSCAPKSIPGGRCVVATQPWRAAAAVAGGLLGWFGGAEPHTVRAELFCKRHLCLQLMEGWGQELILHKSPSDGLLSDENGRISGEHQ